MIYTELEVRGAMTDLHSGMYGGAAPNPFVSICQIIAKLKDENGHILIPGFYDGIIPPSPEELAAWRSLPFDEEEYRRPKWARSNWSARPATACWNAPGRGPRSTCTAFPAALSAQAPRP
jgi:hypothetical protein